MTYHWRHAISAMHTFGTSTKDFGAGPEQLQGRTKGAGAPTRDATYRKIRLDNTQGWPKKVSCTVWWDIQ